MPDFKAKMNKIRFQLGEFAALARSLGCNLAGLLLRGERGKRQWRGREREGEGEVRGREGDSPPPNI